MFIKLPSISFSNKKQINDFDSILPLANKSTNQNHYSVLGYIYDTSSTIGSVISESCQSGFTYVAEVAGSLVKLGKRQADALPKTHQDTLEMSYNNPFGFDYPVTPIHAPILATNTVNTKLSKEHENIIKTPSQSIFH